MCWLDRDLMFTVYIMLSPIKEQEAKAREAREVERIRKIKQIKEAEQRANAPSKANKEIWVCTKLYSFKFIPCTSFFDWKFQLMKSIAKIYFNNQITIVHGLTNFIETQGGKGKGEVSIMDKLLA